MYRLIARGAQCATPCIPPSAPQNELPEQLANSSNTIVWWQSRQADVQERLSKRKATPSPKPADQVGWKAGRPQVGNTVF